MMAHFSRSALLISSLGLAACGTDFSGPFQPAQPGVAVETPEPTDQRPAPRPIDEVEISVSSATPEALDQTTDTERAAATSVSATGEVLGETLATLGDVGEQGFWLKTPLVTSQMEGRIVRTGGATVQVTLIPLDGEASAGSQISLAAMRALDLSLTDIVNLKVLRGTG